MDEKSVKRNEKGQLEKGSAALPNAGRPRKVVERAYLDELVEMVTLEEWRKVVRKALTDAKKGMPEARRWLSEYLVGKPPQILELRAAEAQLLKELLQRLETHGMSASDVFLAMLQQLASADVEEAA